MTRGGERLRCLWCNADATPSRCLVMIERARSRIVYAPTQLSPHYKIIKRSGALESAYTQVWVGNTCTCVRLWLANKCSPTHGPPPRRGRDHRPHDKSPPPNATGWRASAVLYRYRNVFIYLQLCK
ncbi:hypothetical protein EVAR_78664_1 [Eumeta japonica]|uniref:Uncharacterized protein n=1 Tax=Eumeta variegata TaxID=151549 RepID=A0A4C1U8P0_EUMVA|nr:hypothetical protein EVAR_78664_1 [Eumeta japonica]